MVAEAGFLLGVVSVRALRDPVLDVVTLAVPDVGATIIPLIVVTDVAVVAFVVAFAAGIISQLPRFAPLLGL